MIQSRSLLSAKRSTALSLYCGAGARAPLEEADSGCSVDGYSSDGSSQPRTPESPCTPTPETPRLPVEDPLRRRTVDLLRQHLRESAGGARGKGASDPALSTLRRVGQGVRDKHRMAFTGMLRKLDIKSSEDLKPVMSVASHMFEDGVTNWGRIVTLISFGAFVAIHLKSINLESSIDTLAENLSDFLMTSQRDWIVNHKEWDGFVEFFRVEDLEGGIRNVLITLAGVAGVGASLAYMIR